MENKIQEYEELNFYENIRILWKNRFIISTFIFAGLLLGLLFSGVKVLQNPVEYRYQAKVVIELVNGADVSNQSQTMLHVIESNSILKSSMAKLKITEGEYVVRTSASAKPNQYEISVEGPDETLVVELVDEVVEQGRVIASPAMLMQTNMIIENASIFGNPIKVSKNVNLLFNVMLFMIPALMFSVLYVFFIRYLGVKIYGKDEVERILKTKVIVDVPIDTNKILSKFYQVR